MIVTAFSSYESTRAYLESGSSRDLGKAILLGIIAMWSCILLGIRLPI